MAEQSAASEPSKADDTPLEIFIHRTSATPVISGSPSPKSVLPSQLTERQLHNLPLPPSTVGDEEDKYFVTGDSGAPSTSDRDEDRSGSESSNRVHTQRLAAPRDLVCVRLKAAETVASGRFVVVDHEAENVPFHSCEGSLVDDSGSESIEGKSDLDPMVLIIIR
jgi:hypothetical protein